ncbi:hypothetical protein ACPEEZ_09460 [Frigoribacterium sp. 2-23]|uniref:hypothetical protein n=1 Tax=Frigoribacterium sp. 2-23 TaxID=3415006 RepID=UPI003C702756
MGIFYSLCTIAAVFAVFAALYLPIQMTLVVLGLAIAFILLDRTRIIALAVFLVPTLSLVRRLTGGEKGYTDADPLILLPILLVAIVIAASWSNGRVIARHVFARGLIGGVIVGTAATVILRGAFSISALFFAGLLIVPLLLSWVLSDGRLAPVWNPIRTMLAVVSILAGTYGIIQFFFLPTWDRAWMITSQLTSIGQPEPLKVRIFGASESPGPYALFLGLVITMCLASAVVERQLGQRLIWIALGSFLTLPLLLSGVRSALVGIAIAAVVMILIRARGLQRVFLVAFLAGAYYLLKAILSRFGGSSTILTTDRYTGFSAQDDSFVARVRLFSGVGNPLKYIIGNPNLPNADNLFVSTLFRFGLIPASCLLVLFLVVTWLALRNIVDNHAESVSLCAIFISVQAFFGPIFDTLFGIVIGVVFGSVLAFASRRPKVGVIPGLDRDLRAHSRLAA